MSELRVALNDLRPDPSNVRGVYQKIELLAASIQQYGLLQNLVVREMEDHFLIVAGHRRYYALKLLQSRGLWKELVRVLIIDGKGDFEQLAEGGGQEPVYVWRLGRRYMELVDAGYTQMEIGARIGKHQTHISIAIQIARGLSPAIIIRCERLGPSYMSKNSLLRLAQLVDPDTGDPLEREQLELFEKMLTEKRHPRPTRQTSRTEQQTVWLRYRRLRDEQYRGLPEHAKPYVRAIVRYLGGKEKQIRVR